MKRIVIIGGGIAGLAAAHRLTELACATQQPLDIMLLEGSDRLGGTIQTSHRDGFLLERGPDSFISEKPEAVALANRLGIESRLIQTNETHRRSFIVRKGRLRNVPEGFQLLAPSRLLPFITTDIFSLFGKLRMAADLFLPRADANGSNDESLASFVNRRLGQEALDRMAQPMVGGIYTADPKTLSLRATLPRFLEMERKHRSIILAMLRQRKANKTEASGVSGPRYSLFLSFDNGMQVLTDELERSIKTAGIRIKLNSKVISLELSTTEGRPFWTIATSDGSKSQADGVCLAIPAYSAATLLEKIDARLGQQLRAIEYTSTATMNFAYRRDTIRHPLDGFGFVVPFIERRSLIACTFSSVKFSGRAPEPHVLLRAFVGGALQPDIFQLDESEMVARVKSDLEQLLDIQGQPLFVETAKWSRSMPQYYVGHLERISAIETQVNSLPRVSLAGNSYRGAGIPDCVRSGQTAAEKLFHSVSVALATKGVQAMTSHASSHRLEVEQKLREMNDEWTKALVRKDGETLDRIMADDFYFAYPMEGDDKAQFIGDVTSGNIRVEYLNRENVTVRIWGSTAALTAKDSVKWFYSGREFSGHYKVVTVYAERDGQWQMVLVQACPM